MSLKIIKLTIPEESIIELNNFSPEENFLILKIGSSCLLEGRKVIAGLSQKEIYQKIKEESKEEIEKLELEIVLEKEVTKKMEDKISKMYEFQLEKLEKQIEFLSKQNKKYEVDYKDIIKEESEKAREKYDLLLKEKDLQNHLNREVFDKATLLINKNISKSSASIGDDGENIFENLSDTFKDFSGYNIENKSKQGHKGDFHLFFDEFNVLVDSKNYSGSVQKKEVNKIESDLMINDNMKFAWMVSLNTPISEQNRFPITSKWINTDVGLKCILFINNLLSYKEPTNILRQAWFISSEFNKLIKNINKEDIELENYREKELKQKKQIENLQESTREMKRNINTSNNILKKMDKDLMDMLGEFTNKIIYNKFDLLSKINIWWNENIELTNEKCKLLSTEIWNKFKRENKEYIEENKITIEQFKEKITNIVNSSNYIEKNSKKGAIEFIGYKFKEIEIINTNTKMNSFNEKKEEEDFFSQYNEKETHFILDSYQQECINNIIFKDETKLNNNKCPKIKYNRKIT